MYSLSFKAISSKEYTPLGGSVYTSSALSLQLHSVAMQLALRLEAAQTSGANQDNYFRKAPKPVAQLPEIAAIRQR
jgi:hypothetical protein